MADGHDKALTILTQCRASPGCERIFQIGCTRENAIKHIHAQQIRAFNLVWSLRESGRLKEGTTVAVIGAGIAGLTAAIGLAACGVDTTIYEKRSEPLSVQRGNFTRFIHPNVASWCEIPIGAGYPLTHLPYMNWRAGLAGHVNEELEEQWKLAKEVFRLSLKLGQDVKAVSCQKAGSKVDIFVANESPQPFDIVVLAVGPGFEDGKDYWRNDDYAQPVPRTIESQKFVVSGIGDGGLIEVLRLKVNRFQHDEFFNKVMYQDWLKAAAAQIRNGARWETLWEGPTYEGSESFRDFLSDNFLRQDTEVTLLDKSGKFWDNKRSSLLHRLCVHLLWQKNKISKVDKEWRTNNKSWQTRYFPETKFRRVLRNGPISAFDGIVSCTHVRAAAAATIAQSDEITHVPHFDNDFLADELMGCHLESGYAIGFSVNTEDEANLLGQRILNKLRANIRSNFQMLRNGIAGNFQGKSFSLKLSDLNVIGFSGDDVGPGIALPSRSFSSHRLPGLLIETTSRALVENLLVGDEFRYCLFRIRLSENFQEFKEKLHIEIDRFINTDTEVFAIDLTQISNCIELHCISGMFQAFRLLRYPILFEIMANKLKVTSLGGYGWAARNTYIVNREHQRGNELVRAR